MTPEQKTIYNAAYYAAHKERENERTNAWHRENRAWRANYYLANRDKIRAARANRYLKNREPLHATAVRWQSANPDECREYAARYRAANRDKRRAAYTRWAKANRDKIRAWRAANRDRVCATQRKRRATKVGAEGTHTLAEWRALCWSVGWRCKYCDAQLTPATATEEHMTPLSRGGSDWIENIAVSCQPCNSSKHILTVAEFLARRRAAMKEYTNGIQAEASQTESTLNRSTEGV